MPDPSIMLELCEILNISVNELLIGERLKKEELITTSDTNLVKALTIVQKNKKSLKICIIFLVTIILSFHIIFNLS